MWGNCPCEFTLKLSKLSNDVVRKRSEDYMVFLKFYIVVLNDSNLASISKFTFPNSRLEFDIYLVN